LYQTINFDLSRQDADDRPFLRYFELGGGSLNNDAGGACGLTLDAKRQALSKLLNSLSIDPRLNVPVPIDAQERIYRIDLRDYQWDRPGLLMVGEAYSDAWEAIVAHDPYALTFVGDDAADAIADTGTLVPVLLFDSFLAAATEPSVYYGLLDIPDQLDQYRLEQLAIPQTMPTVEAGFLDQNAFLAQYWQLGVRAGYLWDIADFGREWGVLLQSPLGDPLGAHELVFTLPNGLNAFAFMDANSQRLDGWNATPDPLERGGVAQAPRSNWRRHPRTVSVRDEVHDYVEANPDGYRGSDLTQLRQRFAGPEELSLLLERDFDTFQEPALEALGIDPNAPDPILQSYAELARPVTLEVAAAELMVTPEELRQDLDLLDPTLGALAGGTVTRDVFTLLYSQTACVLSAVLDNQPDPDRCN
jgi:hypothetical protein